MANSQDSHYLSLLALAERFRVQEPPNIKACVQCLQAVLTLQPPPKVEGRTHLQLGNLLLHYTTNTHLAKTHLEQAVSVFVISIECDLICTFSSEILRFIKS